MKIKIFLQIGLLSLLLLWANLGFAQVNLSLEEAMKDAIRNRSSSQISELETTNAELALKEAYHALYPKITAGVDFKGNLVRPTTILPGALVGNPGGDDVPVQFGTTYNATGFLDLNYPILDFARGKVFELARLNVEMHKLNETTNDKQIRTEVVAAYYAVLVNLERKKQLEAEQTEAWQLHQEMETRVKAGLVNSIEAERLFSTATQISIDIEKQEKLIALSKMRLNFAMGIKLETEIVFPEELEDLRNSDHQTLPDVDVYALNEIRQAELQSRIAEVEIEKLKRGVLPTISIYGYLGIQGFGNDLNVFDNSSFPWYGISYLGLRASLPLNNLFDYKVQAQRKINATDQVALRQFDIRDQAEFDLQEAQNLREQAAWDLLKADQQLDFAEKNLNFVQVRINTDLARAEDLVKAMTDRSTARIACLVAQYNLIQAIWSQKILAEQY